jgi:pyruvate dehydrogenase E2 component (dihydrolipoamide acetyltransferase)
MAEAYAVKALSARRKIIAARMAEASRTIPHFRLAVDVEVDALLQVRREAKAREPETDVSLNDLLIKACGCALLDAPEVNAQWVEGQLHQYRSADISVVTALADGLSTPIVRNVDAKSAWQISRELRSLVARAANNSLRMEEVFGGSFSISNLGMHGVDRFEAIINPPQCAVLAIGRARPRCVALAHGKVGVATVLSATLSVDHRALDGVAAAAFLAAFRERVQQPQCLLAEPSR